MNQYQTHHTLEWVELLLSGRFKHGRGVLYNPTMDRYCALGVALVEAGQPRNDIGMFILADEQETNALASAKDYGGFLVISKTIVREVWFAQRYGLPKEAAVYSSVNDHSRNFYAVASLLLNACDTSPKQQRLWTKLHDLSDART